ncbi:MAG: hypothetical protein ACRDJB_02945 [Actinomycetota bacterium]
MVTSSKVVIGVGLVVALVVGLSGTFDYARERASRSESTSEDDSTPSPDPLRVEPGRRFPDVDDVRLGGTDEVVSALRRAGFDQVIVLAGGRPTRLIVRFAGEGGTAARTFYEIEGRTVSLGQVKDGLAPLTGSITRLAPSRIALEVRGIYYLSERGFIVTIASGAADLLERLRWRRH